MLALWLGQSPGSAGSLLAGYTFKEKAARDRDVIFVPRLPAAPGIDGVLNEAEWAGACRTDRLTWGGGRAAQNATSLFLAHDSTNFYLAAICATADVSALKTKYPPGNESGGAWGDDCLDFKFSPDNERTTLQFIVTAAGAYYDARNSDVAFNPAWERGTGIGDTGYVVELAIPLTALGIRAYKPGTPVLFNLGRADRTAQQLTVLAEPYLEFDHAPLLVLGTEADYQSFRASGALLRELTLTLYMDRDLYPSFQALATGRVLAASGSSGPPLTGTPAILLSLEKGGKLLAAQRLEPVTSSVLDFDLPLATLAPGVYELVARVADGAEILGTEARREFVIRRATPKRSGRIPITVPAAPAALGSWPLTFGVPFPAGALRSPAEVRLLAPGGAEIPVQAAVTGRWSKHGSVRWLLIDCVCPAAPEPQELTLVYGPRVRRAPVMTRLQVEESATQVTVTTGPLRFSVPRHETPGLAEAWLDRDGNGEFSPPEQVVRQHAAAGPYLVDESGVRYAGSADPDAEVVVESAGPIKACVRVSGWHVAADGAKLGRFILRYYAYAGLPYVRVYHTFITTAGSNQATVGTPPGSPGTEEIRYRDIAYVLPFASSYYYFGTPKVNYGRLRGKQANAYLLQRDDLFCKQYQDGVFMDECEKAEGWMSVGHGNAMLTMAVKDFWQQFPKELEVYGDRALVHFWPAHNDVPLRTGANLSIQNVYQQWFAHEGLLDFKVPGEVLPYIRQDSEKHNYPNAQVINAMGLAKTHEFLLYFHSADWETARARSVSRVFQSNPTAVCAPDWVCGTRVFGEMLAHDTKRHPAIETAIDESLACIYRQREMDRDYGMFNFGDAHHNWDWQGRRWSLHRIWRNTHHGWTRWPWLMYARTGRKDLYDWGDRNARHVADIDHCHYAPKEFLDLPWPRAKQVGGICDYKGFVHWASGARLGYNSAADAMLHHYYFTGDERSRTTALEHGAALLANRRALAHREGSGRATSACALYFYTWDNDYLDFLERTVDTLLSTQNKDGSFPQWEDFAPYLQRYVDLTGSRRGMTAMARWADSACAQRTPCDLHHAKISVLAHAYLYTRQEKYLRTAAYRVHASVDNQYLGEDPRYYGMFIVGHSNLAQSYFLQWIPYYLAAVSRHGGEAAPDLPDRTWIRTHEQVQPDAAARTAWDARHEAAPETLYQWRAALRQARDDPFTLTLVLRGYAGQRFMAEVQAVGSATVRRAFAGIPKHLDRSELSIMCGRDGAPEYALRVYADNNFSIHVPVTYGDSSFREVYPVFAGGTLIGDGCRFHFNLPPGTKRFTLSYQGRSWPLRTRVFAPSGACVGTDTWIGANALPFVARTLTCAAGRELDGWSLSVTGYGQAGLLGLTVEPEQVRAPFHFSLGSDKLFSPR